MNSRVIPLAAAAALLLAGCSTPAPVATDPPLSVVGFENCGVPVTFVTPPERVVTIKSTSTEMLLALGLGDRIVGTAFQDGPVPDEWAAEAEGVPEISDFMPSEEAATASTTRTKRSVRTGHLQTHVAEPMQYMGSSKQDGELSS